MVAMPPRWAASGEANSTGWPAKLMLPPSRRYAPVSTLIRVLLPAPFWPIRAWTSPAATLSEALSRAVTPAKAF